MKRFLYGGAIAGVVVAVLSTAAVSSSANNRPNAHTAATTVQVSGKEYSLKLSTKSLAKPGTVTFNFKNAGHTLHDFRINGKQTPLVKPGKSARLVVSFKKKGNFSYLCTVPGHAAMGMKGVFSVR